MSLGGEEVRAGIEAAEQWPDVVRASTAVEFDAVRQLLALKPLAGAELPAPPPTSMWARAVADVRAWSAMVDHAVTVSAVDEVIETAQHLGVLVPDDIARAQTEYRRGL